MKSVPESPCPAEGGGAAGAQVVTKQQEANTCAG